MENQIACAAVSCCEECKSDCSISGMTEEQIEEWLNDGKITDDQLGKHCNECKHSYWIFGHDTLIWECTKGMPFNPETDINEDHEWLKLEDEEVYPEIYAEAIKQCNGFEIDREAVSKNRMLWSFISDSLEG